MSDTQSTHRTTSNLAYLRRFKNFWSNVSRIVIKPTVSDNTANAVVKAVSESQATLKIRT